jgi:acylphosphatase
MSTNRSVHVVISGRVQGVGYRAWTAETARRNHLSGWVRNRRDGSVEAVFVGDRTAVDAMLDACRDGPPSAAVTRVEVADTTETPASGFEMRATI